MNKIQHVAIIMDGNGRWGIKKSNSRNFGHKAGLKTVETIIKETIKNKIKYLTLYAFSTDNWKRPKKEVNFLLNLLKNYLIKKINDLNKQNIRLIIIGNKKIFTNSLKKIIENCETKTRKNNKLKINLALNYGFKEELINAVKNINKKKITVNEKNISKNLYTSGSPDPDLLIRTGSRRRLSNFLLWQLAYTEIYFEKKLWPDFNKEDYNRVLKNFSNIKRNYGSI